MRASLATLVTVRSSRNSFTIHHPALRICRRPGLRSLAGLRGGRRDSEGLARGKVVLPDKHVPLQPRLPVLINRKRVRVPMVMEAFPSSREILRAPERRWSCPRD